MHAISVPRYSVPTAPCTPTLHGLPSPPHVSFTPPPPPLPATLQGMLDEFLRSRDGNDMIGDLCEGLEARREDLVCPDPSRCYPKTADDRAALESGSVVVKGFRAKVRTGTAVGGVFRLWGKAGRENRRRGWGRERGRAKRVGEVCVAWSPIDLRVVVRYFGWSITVWCLQNSIIDFGSKTIGFGLFVLCFVAVVYCLSGTFCSYIIYHGTGHQSGARSSRVVKTVGVIIMTLACVV